MKKIEFGNILESQIGSPIYLMSNVYQVTSQCGLNASNGLCGEVVATLLQGNHGKVYSVP